MPHSISLEREISASALILFVERFSNQEHKLWKGVRRHEGPVAEAEEIQLCHPLAF
jgi:hypothetical protein